jgi:hypothetical protein
LQLLRVRKERLQAGFALAARERHAVGAQQEALVRARLAEHRLRARRHLIHAAVRKNRAQIQVVRRSRVQRDRHVDVRRGRLGGCPGACVVQPCVGANAPLKARHVVRRAERGGPVGAQALGGELPGDAGPPGLAGF